MPELCKQELCTGCTACANACPVGCIRMHANEEGFLYPCIDGSKCLQCDRCRNVCPVLSHRTVQPESTVAYAAVNPDLVARRKSTSGGIFALLSQWVLSRGGVVFGAAYDESFDVVHCCVDAIDDLAKLHGAKYAQSVLGDGFSQVHQLLEDGRYVLFSGTPCQVAGLVSYLGKPYERLLLVDVICHGVPAPAVWKKYIEFRSDTDNHGVAPSAINLRSKESGWPAYSVRFDYQNGEYYSALNSKDPYLRCFVKDLCLRTSCYDCKFKGAERISDFTLGDYWGVWTQMPDYADGKGTSLVLVHTDKGRKIWQELQSTLQNRQVEVDKALQENPSALYSSVYSEKRIEFMHRYQTEDFVALVDELAPLPVQPKATQSIFGRTIRKIQRVLKSVRPS